MKKEDAALKFCPIIRDKCMTDSCMAWGRATFGNAYQQANLFIEEIDHLSHTAQKILAIKRLREILNITLKDAKDMQELGTYPTMIRQHFNAVEESSDMGERGYCLRFTATTLLNNESIQSY